MQKNSRSDGQRLSDREAEDAGRGVVDEAVSVDVAANSSRTRIQLRNWTTNSWDTIDQYSQGTSDTVKSYLDIANPNDYIRDSNNRIRIRVRTAIRKCRAAIAEGDAEKAKGLLNGTLGLLDRTTKAGAMHDNTASRTKSRLQRAVNKALAAK